MRSKYIFTEQFLRGVKVRPPKIQHEFYDQSFNAGGSFGIRVSRSGSKSYFLIYLLRSSKGTLRRRITLGRYPTLSLNEAKEKAINIVKNIELGLDPKVKKLEPIFFHELVEQLIQSDELSSLNPKTRKEYLRLIDSDLMPFLKDTKIKDITDTKLRALIRSIDEQKDAPILAERVRAVASKLFNYAIKEKIITTNPALGISLKKISNNDKKPEKLLTKSELKSIWEASSHLPIEQKLFARLIISTALTPSKLISLEWANLRSDFIILSKTDTPFRVPLGEITKELIKESLEEIGDDHLLLAKSGKKLSENTQVEIFKKITKKLLNQKITVSLIRESIYRILVDTIKNPFLVDLFFARTSTLKLAPKRFKNINLKDDLLLVATTWNNLLREIINGNETDPKPKLKLVKKEDLEDGNKSDLLNQLNKDNLITLFPKKS